MKLMKLIALCIVVLSLFACASLIPSGPTTKNPISPVPPTTEQAKLNKNMALWQHSNFSSYTYIYKTICFCPPEENILIMVANGQIVTTSYTPSGTPPLARRVKELMTVKELFQVIQKAISDKVARLEVKYNVTSGYPEKIYIDVDERIADEEMTHIVSNLH